MSVNCKVSCTKQREFAHEKVSRMHAAHERDKVHLDEPYKITDENASIEEPSGKMHLLVLSHA